MQMVSIINFVELNRNIEMMFQHSRKLLYKYTKLAACGKGTTKTKQKVDSGFRKLFVGLGF